MKSVVTFLKICNRHVEHNCEGCPFSPDVTKVSDCHKYIINNYKEAYEKMMSYVVDNKKKLGKQEDGTYREKCPDCGTVTIIKNKKSISYDSYLECNVYKCPVCKTLQTLVE